MQATAQLEHELFNPPTDGITCVQYAHKSDLAVVSSWDKTVRIYDTRRNVTLARYEHKAAVLDVCWSADDHRTFSGGIDRTVLMWDVIGTTRSTVLGYHEAPVKCVSYDATHQLVITGGWDCALNQWDPRAQKSLVGNYRHDGAKVYTMDLVGNRLVVGTSNRQVFIYDTRNMSQPEQTRESSLINQTRCIRCFPDGTGYALSSIEGRVAIEYFDVSPAVQKNKYAFKCHRKIQGKTQILYPVNAIAFHPRYGTFATGGCDGVVSVWDGAHKKRICLYPTYPTSIASLSFNHDGTQLAIAASYTFEEGEKEHPADTIYIRTVNDHEVQPKKVATSGK